MRRRLFLGSMTLSSALAAGARAQQRPQISILHSGFPNLTPIHKLYEELAKRGYESGRTATIELQGAEGDVERLRLMAAGLAARRPDVTIALTSPAVRALKEAGMAGPVVFAFVIDPVGLGVVKSFARPGGNFTGQTYSDAALGAKRLSLLLDAVPGCSRVAVLWSRGLTESEAVLDSIQRSAKSRGLELFVRELRGLDDLAPSFDDAARSGAQALIFMTDNLLFGHRKQVAALALSHRLPSMHTFVLEATDGGLMSYGPSLYESYQRVAALAARILKGERPGDLPVEQPTKFDLVLNLSTAKALSLTLPPSLMAQAEEVIE